MVNANESINRLATTRLHGERMIAPGERLESPVPCPDCGGPTEIAIDEWDTKTGLPREAGYRLICIREETGLESSCSSHLLHGEMHDYWWAVWRTAIHNAHSWMLKAGIRVSATGKH